MVDEVLTQSRTPEQRSPVGRLVYFCLTNKLIILLFVLAVVFGGLLVAPFDWRFGRIRRYPVPVDAIPDIGENQQIVFTQWAGRSPQDVEDQVTYRLTVALLGIPKVRTIRSYSMFGFSSIYVIFEEGVDFYWSRARLLERLNSLPSNTLPEGVTPVLGPDATALGQVFWYTLEGLDPDGNPTGGWGPAELRSLQDWTVRYWLLSANGVAEVGSVGGHVKEYQVDVDPDAMRAYGVTLDDVVSAVRAANLDVGARSLEINQVEYFVRGVGFVKRLSDIEQSVVKLRAENVPVSVRDVAKVTFGPAARRGALDKEGAEVVGGVVAARYGANPLQVIHNVKERIAETSNALPARVVFDRAGATPQAVARYAVQHGFEPYGADGTLDRDVWLAHLRAMPREEWPPWATISRLTIVPFYDRTGLIYETLGTLNDAISQEVLVTIVVVLLMMFHLRSGLLISALLPLAVLLCFIAMKLFGVQANIVALSGIAIAIGTIVDMGIVVCENILRRLHDERAGDEDAPAGSSTVAGDATAARGTALETVHRAVSEVGGAVLTAVSTTIVSFLPVFSMTGAEGKLFKPLAYTKTFALLASIVLALTVLPPAAYLLFRDRTGKRRRTLHASGRSRLVSRVTVLSAAVLVAVLLARYWVPLGPARGAVRNLLFVILLIGGLMVGFRAFQWAHTPLLRWCLAHKKTFMTLPIVLVLMGMTAWLGADRLVSRLPASVRNLGACRQLVRLFPGFGREFMPPLDEGSFLWMPTTMTHVSIGQALEILALQDSAFADIPEIESVVGKLGRADTPLDPAPVSMFETVINYRPEYISNANGHPIRFRYDRRREQFVRDDKGELVPDRSGRPYRQWRDHIRSPDDIWQELLKVSELPGVTSAPKLQPIAARIVML
ncbi:MAG: efflux RND transporter permease subunit, partial [Phycisphaerae bacterium]|nr:efflux RND transporter permease subunit [Phycisphaerae bacterium]